MDEGYIKYKSDWKKSEIEIDNDLFDEINIWRNHFYSKNWIGAYSDGIGFGNISLRLQDNQFLISGSATGNYTELEKSNYSIVNNFDFDSNFLKCSGQTEASSEALSHAALYKANSKISRIVHIHNLDLWKKWINRLPTTSNKITYGTPEMAYELQLIMLEMKTDEGLIIMGGHREGIIAFGDDFAKIAELLHDL